MSGGGQVPAPREPSAALSRAPGNGSACRSAARKATDGDCSRVTASADRTANRTGRHPSALRRSEPRPAEAALLAHRAGTRFHWPASEGSCATGCACGMSARIVPDDLLGLRLATLTRAGKRRHRRTRSGKVVAWSSDSGASSPNAGPPLFCLGTDRLDMPKPPVPELGNV